MEDLGNTRNDDLDADAKSDEGDEFADYDITRVAEFFYETRALNKENI